MSVLISGMEMPKDYSVIVKIFPDGRVGTIPYVQWFKVELIDGIQAVPVPEHGRLIDADAEVEVWDVCGRQGVFPHFKTTVSKFLLGHLVGKIPPTIIPAEEAEE